MVGSGEHCSEPTIYKKDKEFNHSQNDCKVFKKNYATEIKVVR